MGPLHRAILGFVIAYGLLHPGAVGAWFQSLAVERARTDIEKRHPTAALTGAIMTLGQSPAGQPDAP